MRTLWAAVFLLISCSGSDREQGTDTQGRDFVSEQTSRCISDHPASEPFDVGDVTVASPAPMSGQSVPEVAAPTVESFAAECQAENGTGCDEAFISKEAARCIAQQDRLEPGLEPWTLAMTYHHSYQRIVWGVENLLEDHGNDGYSGRSVTLDAVSGKVLGRTGWSATP
jgi:hypothetical protein